MANPTCESYQTEREHRDAEGNPDPFSCLRPGATALAVSNSEIAFATSLFISALLSSSNLVRFLLLFWGLLTIVATFAYLLSYEKEFFKIEGYFKVSRHKAVRFLGRHVGLSAGLITFACSLLLSVASVLYG
jgi:cytochrome c oxidase subunit IV